MGSTLEIVLTLVVLAPLVVLAWQAGSTYATLRNPRVIRCPEDHRPAAVRIEMRAAIARAFRAKRLRIVDCTRWPERSNCWQECVFQLDPKASGLKPKLADRGSP